MSVLVLGEFDGFHVGHAALVRAALSVATRFRRPLTGVVLEPADAAPRLMDADTRCRALVAAGVPAVHRLALTDGAASVVDDVVARLEPVLVVMSCAPGGVAGRPHLASAFERHGIAVVEMERTLAAGAPVTSARIRSALIEGRLGEATELLGRRATVAGSVVHGDQLGRTIGFPTANLEPPMGRLVPCSGVYAALAHHDGATHLAAVNIGTRPTIRAGLKLLIEAHLLDFDADIYGSRVQLDLVERLRDEQRFDGLDALTAQLRRDVQQVRDLLTD